MTSALGGKGARVWVKEAMGIKEMLNFSDWRYPPVNTPF